MLSVNAKNRLNWMNKSVNNRVLNYFDLYSFLEADKQKLEQERLKQGLNFYW